MIGVVYSLLLSFLAFLIIPLSYHTHKPMSIGFSKIFCKFHHNQKCALALWRIFRHIISQLLLCNPVGRHTQEQIPADVLPHGRRIIYRGNNIYLGGVCLYVIIPFMFCQYYFSLFRYCFSRFRGQHIYSLCENYTPYALIGNFRMLSPRPLHAV